MKLKDTMTDEEFDSADLPVQVCKSAAGYYIGQLEPCGAPYSRLSDCYYRDRAAAERAMKSGFPTGKVENKELEAELKERGVLVEKTPKEPRRFFRQVIQVEILSEDYPLNYETLEDIYEAITVGERSGKVTEISSEEVDGLAMAKLLTAQDSDPQFFNLTEDGKDMDEEGHEGDGPGASYTRNAHTCVGGEGE